VFARAQEVSRPYAIVGTGQFEFFGNRGEIGKPEKNTPFYGQDAQYPSNIPAYVDHGNGTVTDTVTGLMWEKAYRRLEWADALSAATAASTGGHSDWRVPSTKELYSLMLFSGNQGRGRPDSSVPPADAEPFYNTSAFDFAYPEAGRYIDVQYVTRTEYVATVMDGQRCFFGVNFADGRIKCYPLGGNRSDRRFFGRFVRGNPDYGLNDLTDSGDGTVTDRASGLMWARIDSGDAAFANEIANTEKQNGTMNWEEALRFSENLEFAGHADWRLPNAKQLHSIIDYSRSPDTTGSAAIDPVFASTEILNEAGEPDFPFYWTSTSFRPGFDAVVIEFGRALGYFAPRGRQKGFYDVHGAGSQRTDPKTGSPASGHGPQGDVRRVYNYVRVVRPLGE
jgi:hypothetical protein